MYPSGELERLALKKAQLQLQIALHREQCAVAMTELSVPIAAIDRGIATWRKISPWTKFLALPAGLLFRRLLGGGRRRSAAGGRGWIGKVLTFLPLVLRGWRMVGSMRAAAAGSARVRPSA